MESFKFESVLALQQKKNSIRLDIQPGGVLSLLYRKLLSCKEKMPREDATGHILWSVK